MMKRVLPMLLVAGLLGTFVIASSAVADDREERNELEADLNGRNELDPVTLERGAGDLNGEGEAEIKLRPRAGTVCFELEWEDIGRPIAGHIHQGTRSENGPVVVDLLAAVDEFEHADGEGEAEGCATDVDRALIRAIREHPRAYYVNLHNVRFPGGAIRGQLHREDDD